MKTIARHLIAEYYDCDQAVLDDSAVIRRHMRMAADHIGATVVGEAFHQYSPQGVSGVLLIAESHLSIHTWPRRGYAAIDIFTCGGLDPRPGFAMLAKAFGAASTRVQEVLRGLPEDLADNTVILPEDIRMVTESEEIPVAAPGTGAATELDRAEISRRGVDMPEAQITPRSVSA